MTGATLAQLLDEEELRFEPREGRFDVEAVAAHLDRLGFPFRDAADPSVFVIAASEEQRAGFQARRAQEPDGDFPLALLVQVKPEAVTVAPANTEALAGLTTELLGWLAASRPCRVFNGHDNEVELAPGAP